MPQPNNDLDELKDSFPNGATIKSQIVSSLRYSGMGLGEESTWNEIIATFTEYFPQIYYLYNSGDTYSDYTGGYTASGTYTDYSENQDNCLYFRSFKQSTNASGNYGYLKTVNPVSIESGHKKLICHVSSASQIYGQLQFYVGTSPTIMTKSVVICSYVSSGSNVANKEFTIDISSLSGNYYVGFMIASGGSGSEHATLYVDKIWIE